MIKIAKRPKPRILIQNAARWTRVLQETRAVSGDESAARARYRDDSILRELKLETGGKCCYCECEVTPGLYNIVEHILPWSEFAQLAYFWSNLLLICERCNSFKGAKYDRDDPNINPIRDEPSHHLLYAGPVALAKSQKGRRALIDTRLNRPDLYESRRKHLRRIERMARSVRRDLLADLQVGSPLHDSYIAAENPYSRCAAVFIDLNHSVWMKDTSG